MTETSEERKPVLVGHRGRCRRSGEGRAPSIPCPAGWRQVTSWPGGRFAGEGQAGVEAAGSGGRLDVRVTVRVPEVEAVRGGGCGSAGVSVSDWLRARAAASRDVGPVAQGGPRPKRALGRARVARADPVVVEQLARIGNNLNQLAQWANTEHQAVDVAALYGVGRRLAGLRDAVVAAASQGAGDDRVVVVDLVDGDDQDHHLAAGRTSGTTWRCRCRDGVVWAAWHRVSRRRSALPARERDAAGLNAATWRCCAGTHSWWLTWLIPVTRCGGTPRGDCWHRDDRPTDAQIRAVLDDFGRSLLGPGRADDLDCGAARHPRGGSWGACAHPDRPLRHRPVGRGTRPHRGGTPITGPGLGPVERRAGLGGPRSPRLYSGGAVACLSTSHRRQQRSGAGGEPVVDIREEITADLTDLSHCRTDQQPSGP